MGDKQIKTLEEQLRKHDDPFDVIRKLNVANPDENITYFDVSLKLIKENLNDYEAFMDACEQDRKYDASSLPPLTVFNP